MASIVHVVTILFSFFLRLSALNNGLGLKPAMGWSTWCTEGKCGRDYCSAKEIMSIADAMAINGMKEVGYEYINLDDCWAGQRDTTGTLLPDKDRFPEIANKCQSYLWYIPEFKDVLRASSNPVKENLPSGLIPVINYVNSKGFKFGLYTAAGTYTCQSGGRPYKIPGSYGHYEQDAKTFAMWGVEYLKMDWCNTNINGTELEPKVQYAQMSKALNATGKPIYFSSSEGGKKDPWLWMKDYANSWRTGPDHHDNWASTSAIINHNADLGNYARPGGWNDADFIYTGGQGCGDDRPLEHCPGQTDTEYITEFIMWCMIGSPLIVATDIRNMTDIMKKVLLNTEIISINQDYPGKGGHMMYSGKCSEQNDSGICEVWSKDLSDFSYALAFYNSGPRSSDFFFSFVSLNITGSVLLYDMWTHEAVGHFIGTFSTAVESHGVKVYKVRLV